MFLFNLCESLLEERATCNGQTLIIATGETSVVMLASEVCSQIKNSFLRNRIFSVGELVFRVPKERTLNLAKWLDELKI